MVLNFLNDSLLDYGVNFIYIVLIPNIKNPVNVFEFRSISLCNVIYKLVSKFFANRLKIIIPSIISRTQSVFLPSWLITYNIIIAC